jgi:hypothetical protein
MKELTKLEWTILSSISDDEESVALILEIIRNDFRNISQKEVAETIYKLYQNGLVEDKKEAVDYETLINESEDYAGNYYWFSLTDVGFNYWEKFASIYSDGPNDWSKSWVAQPDYKMGEGFIDGASLEACLQGLDRIDDDKEWKIDRNSLIHSEIEGFQAKYYKHINGGHRITFKFVRR